MNKMIRKLADKAGINYHFAMGAGADMVTDLQVEEFAELIIKECACVAYTTYWNNPETVRGIHFKEKIIEHFGVKE